MGAGTRLKSAPMTSAIHQRQPIIMNIHANPQFLFFWKSGTPLEDDVVRVQ
jgi:hypothetical protein